MAVAFVAFGAVDGTWVARLPAIKDRLGLDSGELGLVILAVSLVATLLLTSAGWLASRRGSRGPILLGLLVVAAALTATAFAPSLRSLLPAACVLGAGWSIVDVAANAHGVAIEHRLGRPVLSALHGAWSFGLLVGSGIAAGAAAAGIGVRAQFPAVAIGVVVAAFLLTPKLLPSAEDAAVETAHFALAERRARAAGVPHLLLDVRRVGDDELERGLPRRPCALECRGRGGRRRRLLDRDGRSPGSPAIRSPCAGASPGLRAAAAR